MTEEESLKTKAAKLGESAITLVGNTLNPQNIGRIVNTTKYLAKESAKLVLNTGVNLLTNPKKAMHTALGVAEKAVNAIPIIGGALSFFFGTSKDALMDAKIEELSKNIDGLRDGLESLANATGEAIDSLRTEMYEGLQALGARQDQLEEFTRAFYKEQEKINKHFQEQIHYLQARLDEHEARLNRHRKEILEQQIKLEEVKNQLKDEAKLAQKEREKLEKEQQELKKDQTKFKHQVNEKATEFQQAAEDIRADYTRRSKIIETQLNDNAEVISDFQENLTNIEHQQRKLNLEHQEFAESLEEQINLSREQRIRLDFVTQEVEEIQEEFHQKLDRITKSQIEQDEKVDEALFASRRATRKVGELTEKLEKHQQEINNLTKKIEKNQQETQAAQQAANLANERLDNLLKTQQLLDYSAEQQNLDKIQKTLELKAEEAQLFASLELLKKTQKLINHSAERDWKVGIKEGTEKDLPRPEGFPLSPNSRWAKQYSIEQLREWGWDTRLLGEHETAPLTDEEKRKLEEATSNQQSQNSEENPETFEQEKKLQKQQLKKLKANYSNN